jgi:Protein of unknown function (DUF2778)
VDSRGLYVDLTYDRSTRSLTGYDTDTGEIYTGSAVSGNGVNSNNPASEGIVGSGPLPGGDYLMGNGYDSGHGGDDWWYRLYGPDGKGGYSYTCIPVVDPGTGKTVCRNGFNLHTGLASDGCVTVPSDVDNSSPAYPTSKSFDDLKKLLEKTKPLDYKGSTFRGYLHVK